MQQIQTQVIEEQENKIYRRGNRENGFRKWFTRDNLVIVVLAGILLFVITLPTKEQPAASSEKKVLEEAAQTAEESVSAVSATEQTKLEEYASAQEQKLKQLLSAMEGVGEVEVMLTFASSEELVVEKDAPVVRSNTVEKDSAGGARTITQYEAGDTTVYTSVAGDSNPYVVKTLSPRVEGVLVMAQGGSDGEVVRNITEAVQALFGVEAHRVKVLDMDEPGTESGVVRGLSGN